MLRWGRVEVSGGFLLTAAVLFYFDTSNLLPWTAMACGLHEAGHCAAVRLLGGRILRLRLTAVGGELVLDRRWPLTPWRELAALLAGPLANLCGALVAARLVGGEGAFLFAGLNLALGALNLAPVWPLDGGRVLWLLTGGTAWWTVARLCSALGTALLLLAGGALLLRTGYNYTLLLLALWLSWGMARGAW